MSTRRPTRRAAPRRRRVGRVLARVVVGDRPYVLALLASLLLLGGMALGPLQAYTATSERVSELAARRDRLAQQVDALEERRTRLEDPEELELLARERLGLVKPGEIPYVVVTPPGASDVPLVDTPSAEERVDPWWRRLGRAFARLFQPVEA